MRQAASVLFFALVVLFFISCGGGGGASSTPPASTTSAATVSTVVVSPGSANQPLGLSQQYTATCTYSNGQTADVTGSAAWSSSDTSIATVSAPGVVVTKAVGSATIKAAFGNVVGSATIAVGPAALASIHISVASNPVYIGSSTAVAVQGSYTDGTTKDVTSGSSLNSSNSYVATIDSQASVIPRLEGLTTVSAIDGSFSSSVDVSVISKPRFAYVPDASRVNAYTVDAATGRLRLTTYNPRDNVQDICVSISPDKQFAVVGNYRGTRGAPGFLTLYRVDQTTGELAWLQDAAANLDSPYCAAFTPDGRFVYAANDSSATVAGFALNGTTGTLTSTGAPADCGPNPRGITMDPLGRYLYVSNSGSSDISVYQVNTSTGVLTSVSGSPIQSFVGSDLVSIHPSGRWAVVSANNTNQMAVYSVGSNGLFSFIQSRTVNGGPSPVVFNPAGTRAYFTALNAANNGYILETDQVNSDGSLTKLAQTALPEGAFGYPVIDPEGKRLYISAFDYLLAFSLGADGTPGPYTNFAAAMANNSFYSVTFLGGAAAVSQETSRVYAADTGNNILFGFNFDFATGQLTPTATPRYFIGTHLASVASDFHGYNIFAASAQSAQPNLFAFTADSAGVLTPLANPFSLYVSVPEFISSDTNGDFVYVTDSFAPEHLNAFSRIVGIGGQLGGFLPQLIGGYASSLALDPFTRFALLTLRDQDAVSGYRLQSTNGGIAGPFLDPSYSVGTTPMFGYLEPLARFYFVANNGSSDITVLRPTWAPTGYTLPQIGGNVPVPSPPSRMVADPGGTTLYVGTVAGDIYSYAISESGALTATTLHALADGSIYSMAIDAGARYLFVGTGVGLYVYSIQPDGTLNAAPVRAQVGKFGSIATTNTVQ